MNPRLVVAVTVFLACGAAVASAQSLGDVARQEETRRKGVKAPAKVYTNESLRSDPASSPAPAPVAGTPSPAGASSSAGQPSPPAENQGKDEAFWKKRISEARLALDRAQSFAEALQTRINSLTNDWAARDDPAQRSKIGADRTKALAELDRLKQEIQDNTRLIATIQDDARKAGVPAGWVR